MPLLAASWGRSAAACRLSPTWYNLVVIEGPGCLGVGGPVAAVSRAQIGGDQGFDRAAGQLAVRIAEHLLQPQVGQRERSAAAGQRHPILQRVDQLRSAGPGNTTWRPAASKSAAAPSPFLADGCKDLAFMPSASPDPGRGR